MPHIIDRPDDGSQELEPLRDIIDQPVADQSELTHEVEDWSTDELLDEDVTP